MLSKITLISPRKPKKKHMRILIYKVGRGICNTKQLSLLLAALTLFTQTPWKICDSKWLQVFVCVSACLPAFFVVFSVTQCCQVAMQIQDYHSVIRLWSTMAHLVEAADVEGDGGGGGWGGVGGQQKSATVGASSHGTVANPWSLA